MIKNLEMPCIFIGFHYWLHIIIVTFYFRVKYREFLNPFYKKKAESKEMKSQRDQMGSFLRHHKKAMSFQDLRKKETFLEEKRAGKEQEPKAIENPKDTPRTLLTIDEELEVPHKPLFDFFSHHKIDVIQLISSLNGKFLIFSFKSNCS